MNFINYIENKIFYILFQLLTIITLSVMLNIANVNKYYVIYIAVLLMCLLIIYLIIDYFIIKKENKKIITIVDDLNEKYYISEILPKSNKLENKAYRYALKSACKAMNDKLGKLEQEKLEYQEYIESFVHEIKTPISALSLSLDNENELELKNEVNKIDLLVEQILYVARSNNTEKDYFIRKLCLSELVHQVILKYKYYLLNNKIILDIHDLEEDIYTDEKWLIFVISQIIQNSIKYLDKAKKKIEIFSQKGKDNVILTIKDNGCGIKESDLIRVFEKGFTGSDRTKSKSTGMGLYLSKKICNNLGLDIDITSKHQEETTVKIIIPKSNFNRLH